MKTTAINVICSLGFGMATLWNCDDQSKCTEYKLTKLSGDCGGCQWELCFTLVNNDGCPNAIDYIGVPNTDDECDPKWGTGVAWDRCAKTEQFGIQETRCFKAEAEKTIQFIVRDDNGCKEQDDIAKYEIAPDNVNCPETVELKCGQAPNFINPATETTHSEDESVCGGGSSTVKKECMWQMIMPACCQDTTTTTTTTTTFTTSTTTTTATATTTTTSTATTTTATSTAESATTTATAIESTTTTTATAIESTTTTTATATESATTTTTTKSTTLQTTQTPTRPPAQDLGSLPANIHTAIGDQLGYDVSGFFGVQADESSDFRQSGMYPQQTAAVLCVGLVAGISMVLLVRHVRPQRHPEQPPLEAAELLVDQGLETQLDDQ